jgi:hypothetical protein
VKTNLECDKELLPKCDGDAIVFSRAAALASGLAIRRQKARSRRAFRRPKRRYHHGPP